METINMPCVVNETYQQRPHQRYTLESLPQPLKKKSDLQSTHIYFILVILHSQILRQGKPASYFSLIVQQVCN